MLSQTYSNSDPASFEHSVTSSEIRQDTKARLVQEEVNQGDFLAMELQKSLNSLEIFSSSPLYLHSSTIRQVQHNVEPFVEMYSLLTIVNDITYRHSCPVCGTSDNVSLNGRNNKQRYCKNHHDNAKSKYGYLYFSPSTSSEGRSLILLISNFVSQQLFGNATHDFISQFLGVSRYLVEFVSSFLAENLNLLSFSDLDLNNGYKGNRDLLVIFSDFSGSRLSKNTSLLVAEVDGEKIWYLYQSPNSQAASSLVQDLSVEVRRQNFSGQIVFITDGEKGWLNPIRDTFPNAIHVRQFHKQTILGTIFVHFMHENQEHTLKCRWDLVKDTIIELPKTAYIQKETISKSTLDKRKWRQSQIDLQNQQSDSDSNNHEDPMLVVLYRCRVWTTRGTDRKSSSGTNQSSVNTPTDAYIDIPRPNVEVQNSKGKYNSKIEKSKDTDVREGVDKNTSLNKRGRKSYVSSVLFRGGIGDALVQYPWLQSVYSVLVCIFGGLYISSNRAEQPFQIKHRLAHHGTMKAGYRHLLMQLGFSQFHNLEAFRGWLKSNMDGIKLLFHDIQRDKLMRTRNQSRKELLMHLVQDQMLVISYQNLKGESSIRVIKILEQVQENGVFSAYCFLRSEERNFQSDRIKQFCTLEDYHRYLMKNNRFDTDGGSDE